MLGATAPCGVVYLSALAVSSWPSQIVRVFFRRDFLKVVKRGIEAKLFLRGDQAMTTPEADQISEVLEALAALFREKRHCPDRLPPTCSGALHRCMYQGDDCPHQVGKEGGSCRWHRTAEQLLQTVPEKLMQEVLHSRECQSDDGPWVDSRSWGVSFSHGCAVIMHTEENNQ